MAKSFEDYNAQIARIREQLEQFDRFGYLPGAPGYSRDQIANDMIAVVQERDKVYGKYNQRRQQNTGSVSGSSTISSFDRAEARRFENIRNNSSAINRTNTPLRPGSVGPGSTPYTGDVESEVGTVMDFDDARIGARTILDRFGGLGSLTDMVTLFIMDKGEDYTQDDILTYIRSSDAYQKRFAGNAARAKANLPTYDEVSYLRLEDNYRQAMRQYLPSGFYDTPQDFVRFMANDISAEEIGTRAKTAYLLSQKANKDARRALKDFYGIGDKEIAAYFLDATKATPLLTERANAAIIGGEALRADLQIGRKYAETLAQEGLTGQAREAFTETARSMGTTNLLGSLAGERILARDIADSELGRNVKAINKISGLRSQQRARFGGSSAGTQILGTDLPGTF